ncbi:hypothetical protein BQ8482_260013 [Mesorhizobium delmotii]|uniref:Uncharacterized protein n=1 Tax=Mesorhizobium delmotii TaxID=1631247 RepID=A0A2P9AM74_9HYPH|nr:hypothetical protein BQ8482_260013 [Mesorhizobium delmotii]
MIDLTERALADPQMKLELPARKMEDNS